MAFLKKLVALGVALTMCLILFGCAEKKARDPAPTRDNKPILPGYSETDPSPNDYTAVYVTVFDDVAILATYPILKNPDPEAPYEKQDPTCGPHELSDGGSILCGGDHEKERPITKVLVADQLVPKSMAGWFRDMIHLQEVIGLEKILTHHVEDMNHLFAGCGRLAEANIEAWDVSAVTDFTGIFEGCSALSVLPSWYKLENNESFG